MYKYTCAAYICESLEFNTHKTRTQTRTTYKKKHFDHRIVCKIIYHTLMKVCARMFESTVIVVLVELLVVVWNYCGMALALCSRYV